MGKLYIIAYRNSAFNYLFEEAEKTENIVVIENGLAAPKNFFKKLTRFLFAGKCPLPISILQTWFNKDFLRQLKNIKDDDALLVFENINLRALGMLYHLLPKNIKKYNWFGNPVYPLFNGKSPMKRFKAIKKLGFELVSFDSQDANQYDMTFHNQFLRFPTHTSGTTPDVDFYFVGGPKDRENYLMELRKFLELRGSTCRFLIPHSPQEFISYDENIRNVERCRCIVDIYQSFSLSPLLSVYWLNLSLCSFWRAITSLFSVLSMVVVAVGFASSFFPNSPKKPVRFLFFGSSCELFNAMAGTCLAIFSFISSCS